MALIPPCPLGGFLGRGGGVLLCTGPFGGVLGKGGGGSLGLAIIGFSEVMDLDGTKAGSAGVELTSISEVFGTQVLGVVRSCS